MRREKMKTIIRVIPVLVFVMILNSCDLFNNNVNDGRIIINNNVSDLSSRLEIKDEQIPLNGFDGATLSKTTAQDSSSFILVLRAEVPAPVHNGKTLRASHVAIENDYAFVAYNYEGEEYLGGIEVYDISDIVHPTLISQAILTDTDVSSIAYKDGALYLAEAQNPYIHDELQSAAVLEKMILSNGLLTTNTLKVDLGSYVATDVDVSSEYIYATTGSNGFIYEIDPVDLSILDTIGSENDYLGLAVDNDMIVYLNSKDFTSVWSYDRINDAGGWGIGFVKTLPESKGVVTIDDHYAYVAMNEHGVKVFDVNTGTIVDEIARPITPQGASEIDYVTNGVSVNGELVLIANGAAGVWVGSKYDGEAMEIYGSMDFQSSTNFVEGKDDVIFVATGFGGFRILEVQRYMPEEGDFLTLGTWDSLGLPDYIEPDLYDIDDSLLTDIHTALPWTQSAPDNNPGFFDSTETNLVMTQDAGLYVTYIYESAGFKNTLGYYTFDPLNPPSTPEDIDDMTIIFPNSSMLGSGGALERGHTVFLGNYTAGTGIGFFLISNGWKDGDVTKGLYSHYTHYDMNPESDPSIRQHTVVLKDVKRDLLVMGFEDVSRKYASCDQDFDDAVFLIHSDPKNAYVMDDMANLDTSASTKSKQEITVFSEMKGWTPWYTSGYAEDNNIYVSGSNSGKITINGSLTGARLIQGPTDFSEKSIRIRFRAEDWKALTEFTIRFYTNVESSDGYILNFRNYFNQPNNGEWYDIVFPRSAFEAIGDSPNWSTVRTIYIRGNSKTSTAVYIDEILLVDDKPFEGVVTLSFDDGYDDVFSEAATYMNKYGFLGTAFIMPDQIGEIGYMTEAQLRELNTQGWGIGGHHIKNLRTLSLADAEIAVSSTKYWLKERSFNGQDHFAYPNGSYNAEIQKMILKYFTTSRTIDGFNQPFACIIPENINSRTISNETSVFTLKSQIDQAIINNEWLILNFHKLVEVAMNDVEYSITDFQEIIKYLYENGVTVMPYHRVLAEFCEK